MPVPARPRARAQFDGWWFCNRRRRRRAEVRRPERPDAPVTVAHGDAAAVRSGARGLDRLDHGLERSASLEDELGALLGFEPVA